MTDTKAIELLQIQLDKADEINSDNHFSWKTQTASYIKDIFGDDSTQYEYISNFVFVVVYNDDYGYKRQVKSCIPYLKQFLTGCIETVERNGIKKAKKSPDEHWSKRHPILFEILKAVIILAVGYLFRYFTEPKGNQQENKTPTSQSPSK